MALRTDKETEIPEAALASFVSRTKFDDLPDDVVDTIRRAFIDTVGVILAGTDAESGDVVTSYLKRDGVPNANLLDGEPLPLTSATLAYGTASHALDYDDLSWGMDGHPSVVLIPPILAVADHQTVTGKDAVTAYAVGFEVACAVAAPISPEHYETGWHATATFGTFGAAAAVASLLDLSATETETALNITASTPSGTKRNFGSMTKPLHAGLAARSGVSAAQLAAEGFTSGDQAISGDKGFWDLYGDVMDETPSADLEGWAIDEHGVHVKRYPCCYFTHSSIAAVQSLVDEHGFDADDVEHVDVYAAGGACDALSYTHPESELEAKFSMQHAVAVGVTKNRIELSAFEPETFQNETVRSLYDEIKLHVDESLPYDSHEARVEVDLGERIVSKTREEPPWVHEAPPSEEELRRKFFKCATRTVDEDRAEQLYSRLSELPDADLTALLR